MTASSISIARSCCSGHGAMPLAPVVPTAGVGEGSLDVESFIVIEPFFMGAMEGDDDDLEETDALTDRPDFHNCAALPGVPKMSVERHLWDHGESLLRLAGAGLWKERV